MCGVLGLVDMNSVCVDAFSVVYGGGRWRFGASQAVPGMGVRFLYIRWRAWSALESLLEMT